MAHDAHRALRRHGHSHMNMVTYNGWMETEISKSRFKAQALEVFRQIEATGDPVIITDRGEPTLIVKRYTPAAALLQQRLKGSVVRYADPLEPAGEDDWEPAE